MKKVYWKDIPGYEGLYEASNYGEIKSLNYRGNGNEQILKPSLSKNKYYRITLTKNRLHKTFLVHQLVAQAFIGHVIDGHNLVIDHEDNDGTNNYIGTPEGNWKDGNLHIVPNRDNLSICPRKDRDTMSSPLSGASWSKRDKKWKSYIGFNGKCYYIGQFNTAIEAHLRWKEATESINNNKFEKFMLTIENKQIKQVNQYNKEGEFIRSWNRIMDIERELGINKSNITSCCRGKRKSAGEFKWSYVDNIEK